MRLTRSGRTRSPRIRSPPNDRSLSVCRGGAGRARQVRHQAAAKLRGRCSPSFHSRLADFHRADFHRADFHRADFYRADFYPSGQDQQLGLPSASMATSLARIE
ncbi:MAG: pentapeptide repeat-containing protein [Stellaceae bacterium]